MRWRCASRILPRVAAPAFTLPLFAERLADLFSFVAA